jgi:hypothetical protein
MARLQKESDELMSLRLRELTRLEDQIARDESRSDEIISLLMEGGILDGATGSDNLISELNAVGKRLETNKANLARLKAPSELTEEDKEYLPAPESSERFNIKY